MDDIYDLVVIGAGPAGEVAAELAASFGRRALVVERSKPGGVVTTTGGAPTKALREAAVYLTGYRQEEVYGVRAAVPLDEVVPILRARVERVRDVLQGAVEQRLAARGIAYLQGTARLGADRTVRVTSPDGRGAPAGGARDPAGDGVPPDAPRGRPVRRSRRLRLRRDLLVPQGPRGSRRRRQWRGRGRVRNCAHRARHPGDAGQPVGAPAARLSTASWPGWPPPSSSGAVYGWSLAPTRKRCAGWTAG